MFKVELTNNAGDNETSLGVSLNQVLKNVLGKVLDKDAYGKTRCTIYKDDEELSWSWGSSAKEAVTMAQRKMKKFEDFRKDIL